MQAAQMVIVAISNAQIQVVLAVDITTAVPTTTPHIPGVHLCGLL